MSDLNEWLKERRTIRAGGGDDMGVNSPKSVRAIVDAHNNLPALLTAVEKVIEVLDGWEPPDPCSLEGDPCLDCLMINEMRRAIEGAINEQ